MTSRSLHRRDECDLRRREQTPPGESVADCPECEALTSEYQTVAPMPWELEEWQEEARDA